MIITPMYHIVLRAPGEKVTTSRSLPVMARSIRLAEALDAGDMAKVTVELIGFA